MSASAGIASGCDAGDRHDQPRDNPPPKVLAVKAFNAKGELVTLASGPTETVLPNTSFHVSFDRFLLPVSATRQAICLQTGVGPVKTAADCMRSETVEPGYDPVTREIVFRLPTPNTLFVQATYQLTIYQAPDDDSIDTGVRAFDGTPLAAPVSVEFTVANVAADNPDPSPTGDLYCQQNAECMAGCTQGVCNCSPQSLLKGSCTFNGCHKSSVIAGAAMDLQFDSPDSTEQASAIRRTAIGHVAHETMLGENASLPDESPSRFGRAMPIIDAEGSAGNSYMLYKLLISTDAAMNSFASPDEVTRLREGFVVANPMPLYSAPGQKPALLTLEQVEMLSLWIQAGAAVDNKCP